MTDQPEALRLADAIDPFVRQFAPDHLTSKVAADELRRLHALNAELLEALKFVAEHNLSGADLSACGYMAHGFVHSCRTAIAKAEASHDLHRPRKTNPNLSDAIDRQG